jgi:DNA-binding NarL/FixJ family response regulator
MSSFRVLLVGGKDRIPKEFPSILDRGFPPKMLSEVSAATHSALARLSEKGFDAAICWIQSEEELAGVIRIRKTQPDLPVMVVTSIEDAIFADRARQMGASKVIHAGRDLAVLAEHIRLVLESGELHRELAAQTSKARANAKDVSTLAGENRELAMAALAQVRKPGSATFVPLLVDDDSSQALLMLRAFQNCHVLTPLPVLRTGEEAMAYLADVGSSGSRVSTPLPSVLLLDVNLPGKSGLDVLQWIRQQPRLARLPVVMLSCVTDPEIINQAYQLGANSFLVKPTDFQALVQLAAGLQAYWGRVIDP